MGQTIPILVKIWAGEKKYDFRYIDKSLRSLLKSDLPPQARVILADDCSTDPRLQPFLQWCIKQDPQFELWTNPHHMGPNRSHEYNFARMFERYPDSPFYGNCDDDMSYHPGWLQRLLQVAEEARAEGLNGIFTAMNTPFREARGSRQLSTSEVLLKERQAAFNWLVPHDVYDKVGPFRDTGIAFDTDYCNRMTAFGLLVICLKPSWVQNIGYHGRYQHSDALAARDYVGRRDLYLYSRDQWYRIRRGMSATIGWVQNQLPALEHIRQSRKKTIGKVWGA